jgi:endonuclease III-like uncharacterized protein
MSDVLFATIYKEELITWSYKKIKQVIKQSGFYNSGVIFYIIKTSRLIIINGTASLPDLASVTDHVLFRHMPYIVE